MRDELLELISEKKFLEAKKMLSEMLVQDIAEVLESLKNPADVIIIFRLLHKDEASDVFSYVDNDVQELIVNSLSDAEVARIVEDLAVDDAVDFIEEMPANVVKKVLKNTTAETRNTINKLLSYAEDTAGSIMTTEF